MTIKNGILLFLLSLCSCGYPHFGSGSLVLLTLNNHANAFSLSELSRSLSSKNCRRCGGYMSRTTSTNIWFGATQKSKPTWATASDDSEGQQQQEEEPKSPVAWTIPKGTRFGRLDKLELLPIEEKSSSESKDTNAVSIATKAIGLNFADIFTVLGLYSAANLVRGASLSSFVPGLEFSGCVVQDPSGTYQTGDRVLGFTRFGAYSEVVEVPPEFLVPRPNSWKHSQGASFLVQALTAWHGLVEIGRMPLLTQKKTQAADEVETPAARKPFVVIVHSASGGVGLWASELAARRGGTVLGIVGDASKARVFEDRIVSSKLSPDSKVMIRGSERDFSKRLAQELLQMHNNGKEKPDDRAAPSGVTTEEPSLSELAKTGSGADLVMESLGGKYFEASFDALNDGGALVTFGSTTYSSPGRGGINLLRLIWRYLTRPRIDPGDLTARNLRLAGFNLIFLTEQRAQLRKELSECISCLSGNHDGERIDTSSLLSLDGVTPPVIGETFDFQTQAVDAMEALKSGKTVGKVVLVNGYDE